MVFKSFALSIIMRVALLLLTLCGLSLALISSGYYGVITLLALVVSGQVFELYRYVNKTNLQLIRFFESVRFGDFGQQFKSSDQGKGQGAGQGAGFDELAAVFSDLLTRFNDARESQELQLRQLKSMTEHIPVPLLSLHPGGDIRLHNNAARQLFGSMDVNKIDDLALYGQDFMSAIRNLAPGTRQLVNFKFDGVERQLTVVISQVFTNTTTRTVSENLISLQDIQSELDSVQLQAWQDLVRVLTHEIMNSITPVASLAKTATDLVEDASEKVTNNASIEEILDELNDVKRATSTVARRSDSLMQFVQSYRSLTQLPTPQKQKLPVEALFQRLHSLFQKPWQDKGITLNIQIEPPSLELFADPDLLEQVLINLLTNAEQALLNAEHNTEQSTDLPVLNPCVNLKGRMNQRGYVLLEVADNGPGIQVEIAKEIFMPFYTTKQKGSGVGLALTRQIMMAHGGNVSLSACEGGGARFTLIF
ncbi:MAG: histidine kinase [Algicola sp.]|nr:histidine kinase [Algicola sp.]